MLEFVRGKVSERKFRLLAVACCRRMQHRLRNPAGHGALDLLEKFADGTASRKQLKAARWEAARVAELRLWDQSAENSLRASAAAWAVVLALDDNFFDASEDVLGTAREASLTPKELRLREKPFGWPPDRETARRRYNRIWGRESKAQCALVREIFGPLVFRRVRVKKAWLRCDHDTVPRIAQTIYEHRAFELMPLLANALKQAGCDNAEILAHCHQRGAHVRGCWVVDLLLGKS
jgi:hypothetical protein